MIRKPRACEKNGLEPSVNCPIRNALRFLLPGLFLIILDQVTKHLAILYFKGREDLVLLPGVLKLTYVENRGIAWGMFQGRITFFVIFTILFLLFLCFVYLRMPYTAYYRPLRFVLSGMAAGAIGNFADRVFRGYVIDLIYFCLIDFPVFNVADICVVLSGILLVILVCFHYSDGDFDFLSTRKGRLK